MITIDWTMPIHIVNMLILIVLMNIVLYKPIRGILEERGIRIGGMKKDIDTFNKNAQLRHDEFDQKISDARVKAKAELDAAKGSAQDEASDKLAGVRKEVDAEKATQMSSIASEVASAGAELKGQVEGFANEMAGKILGRAI